MDFDIKVTDNSGKFLSELARKKILALAQIGQLAEGFAKSDCPVHTGRLKNSITWATATQYGTYSYTDDKRNSFTEASRKPDDNDAVYIGSNVVYAARQEYGDSFSHTVGKAHFLRDAATTHGTEYKTAVENIMKA